MPETVPANSGIGPLPARYNERVLFVGRQLEGVWLAHVLKETRGAAKSFVDRSTASKMFKEMFDEVLAQKMAERGTLGLAETIVRNVQPEILSGTQFPQPNTPHNENQEKEGQS